MKPLQRKDFLYSTLPARPSLLGTQEEAVALVVWFECTEKELQV